MLALTQLVGFDPVINVPLQIHISSNTTNVNLRTLANGAGYSSQKNVIFFVDAGVVVGGTTASTPAIFSGSWTPGSVVLTLVNNGTISGCGGNGGAGANPPGTLYGQPGLPGGSALSTTYPITVQNNGVIQGGGGGGGGSGNNGTNSSGGGGGAGNVVGNGASGSGTGAGTGANGTLSTGGTYAFGTGGGWPSGAGGNPGQNGYRGQGSALGGGGSYPGGVGGPATIGVSFITWAPKGTVVGILT